MFSSLNNRKTQLWLAALVIFILIITFTSFGKMGVFTLLDLKERKGEITSNVFELEQENELLKQELIRLQRRDYQEHAVRSQMGMAKEGEVIYIFTDE